MKIIQIRRLETIEEMEMRKFVLQHADRIPEPEENITLEQSSEIPKFIKKELLLTKEFEVSNELYNELLFLLKEFDIPSKPIENGIEIVYFNKESMKYIGLSGS